MAIGFYVRLLIGGLLLTLAGCSSRPAPNAPAPAEMPKQEAASGHAPSPSPPLPISQSKPKPVPAPHVHAASRMRPIPKLEVPKIKDSAVPPVPCHRGQLSTLLHPCAQIAVGAVAAPSATKQTTVIDFPDETVSGNLLKPDGPDNGKTPATDHKVIRLDDGVAVMGKQVPPGVWTYPNIEAPDMVAPQQEIAVQVSLTADDQLAPETKIVGGTQSGGKLQLQMQSDEQQWTLTVNVSAPGLELTRGSNTAEITVTRDGNSTVAAFYMRPKLGPNGELPAMTDTRILATLLHKGAFVARLSRPITIAGAEGSAKSPESGTHATTRPASSEEVAQYANVHHVSITGTSRSAGAALDVTAAEPGITIVENRVGNLLRIVLFFPNRAPVLMDIDDAAALHTWIDSHFAQMARHGRGFVVEQDKADTAVESGGDYLNAFGNELYDRVVPDAQKSVLVAALKGEGMRSIQVFSDDPSIPWELMRPVDPETGRRMGFLDETASIARWPMMRRGLARPRQSMVLSNSVVVAPQYDGAMTLAESKVELQALLQTPTFHEVDGSYGTVRKVAENPPPGIVHFAGHGAVTQENGVAQYRILLKDGAIGPEAWAALNVSDADAGTLYFFNACEVGEAAQFMNEVDGWAPALLGSGANGYIGALWPISDSTAKIFAATFYQQLTEELAQNPRGAAVGEVLTSTRVKVFSQTHDVTALAYVFYGDPELRVLKAK